MPNNWLLTETSFNPQRLRSQETIFTIGNGAFCTRGSFEESYPGETPATLARGLYDDIPTYQSELVNLPNWLWLQIWVDGEPFRMDRGISSSYRRTLDLYTGCLARRVAWRSPSGQSLEMEWERWIRLADPHAMAIRLRLVSLDFSGKLEVQAGLDGWASNGRLRHWELQNQGAAGEAGGFLHLRTRSTRLEICQAFTLRVEAGETVSFERQEAHCTPGVRVSAEVVPGQALRLDKLVSLFTSADVPVEGPDAPRDDLSVGESLTCQALAHLEGMAERGYDRLRQESVAAWEELWRDCGLTIDGDPEAELAARFNLFQLLIAAPHHTPRGSIPARSLSGFGYHGHVFWDAELYMLPFFLYTRPALARRMLLYRYDTLPGARAKAQEKGWKGCMFAWESAATGEETTPRWIPEPNGVKLERIWSGDLSVFTTAGVAWAVDQYWKITGDEAFMRDFGAELVLETARFWESRVEWNPDAGCYALTNVIGPDEFHLHVDNNAFTNHLARRNLEIALQAWEWLRRTAPTKAQELAAALALDEDRLQRWQHIAGNISFRHDPQTGLIEQFEGYFKLAEIDLGAYEPRHQSIQVILGLQRSQQVQVTRQPDVALLLHLVADLLDRQGALANWRYYAPRTDLSHGSSLGYSIYAALAARLGEVESAYRYFQSAATLDLADRFDNTANGVHIGNAGGVWQALVLGFAGLQVEGDVYRLQPCLPAHWRRLAFTVTLRGRRRPIEIINPVGAPGSYPPTRAAREDAAPPASSGRSQEGCLTAPLAQSLPGMTYRGLCDARRTMLAVNAYCFNLTGLHPAELVQGQLYGDLIHPHDRPYVWSELRKAVQEKRSYYLIYRIITASQKEKWVWENGRGHDDLLEGSVIELTGRNTEYEALSEYAERLESLREIDRAILAARSSTEVIHIALRALRRLAPSIRVYLILLDLPARQAEAFSLTERSQEITRRLFTVTSDLARWWSALEGASTQAGSFAGLEVAWPDLDFLGEELSASLGDHDRLVSLRSQGALVGILALCSAEPGMLADSPLGFANELANSLAIAITQRRLLEQVNSANRSLQNLSRRLVDLQEQERRSLARELHDEIGQALTAIKINLESLQFLPADASQKRLEDSIQVVSQTLQQVRNLSLDLRPALLDELGLVATLRWYVDRLAQWNELDAQFQADLQQERLPAEIETTLFRVAQEALTNVIRHAGARRVVVLLFQSGDRLILQIRDNGRGFEVAEALRAASRGNSLGLLGIQERLHLIGGQLAIHSTPGMGSEISVEIPFSRVEGE